ncbi:DUF1801 domain-containing protein [Glutamicibacter sp. JL.03c]|uniref:DUF1801 domain-containing protein n=1 Tax=Glutamicibacter sp. JL.03c TaxID=2984842 RepID=UPI0021F6B731|nr:DUF1801 domain-containing protein [Glutamicibacter sp. JL.03c]UYQ78312.1 DUF1801 domain-containing protein [Glutamicibacter sp. JL.03c]
MPSTQPAMSPSGLPVESVLDRASGPRRAEAEELVEIFRGISHAEPVVWAGRILGFGELEYRYQSGHGGIAPLLAFAPGPKNHTIYLVSDFAERWPDLLGKLGKHRSSKVCLYITRLANVDRTVLRELLQRTMTLTLEESSGGG